MGINDRKELLMQFKAVFKDCKVTKGGLTIRVLASDDCAVDDLRMYLEEPVMVDINLITPEAEYAYELDGE